MKGNEAIAHAAIRYGVDGYFGYPITPQSEVLETLEAEMPWETTGMVVLQAESEIASINMVYGGAATGKAVMTSSSSPGISLMQEGISYLAGSDVPALIINVQRGGPGLGGIQPSQADYWQATRAMGHGDFHILVFAPSSVQDMVDMVTKAFDTADKYRMPAMILADGLLGQMMEPVTFPEIHSAEPEKPWATVGHKNKREHNIVNSLFLQPDILENSVKARYERYEGIIENEQDAECYLCEDAEIVVCAYGASARVAKSAVSKARENGIKAGLFRPKTVWPFPEKAINENCKNAKVFLSAEMSMGQMVDDINTAIKFTRPVEFFGRTGGVIPTPAEILREIERIGGAL